MRVRWNDMPVRRIDISVRLVDRSVRYSDRSVRWSDRSVRYSTVSCGVPTGRYGDWTVRSGRPSTRPRPCPAFDLSTCGIGGTGVSSTCPGLGIGVIGVSSRRPGRIRSDWRLVSVMDRTPLSETAQLRSRTRAAQDQVGGEGAGATIASACLRSSWGARNGTDRDRTKRSAIGPAGPSGRCRGDAVHPAHNHQASPSRLAWRRQR